jgi:LPS sulfotransferase NodH
MADPANTAMEMTRFVLLSTQRSGSTWVIDTLNSHPAVTAYGELFLQNGQGSPPWGGRDMVFYETFLKQKRDEMNRPQRLNQFLQYLETVYSTRNGNEATGFKLMYGQQGAHGDLYPYIVLNRISVVHLIRRNYLDIILSKEAAVARDLFHAHIGEEVQHVKVHLNAGDLLNRLRQQERDVEKARERFSRFALPYMEVYYEDLISGNQGFGLMLDFLRVKQRTAELVSPLRKLNPVAHREIIENYESVEDLLKGTAYAGLLR